MEYHAPHIQGLLGPGPLSNSTSFGNYQDHSPSLIEFDVESIPAEESPAAATAQELLTSELRTGGDNKNRQLVRTRSFPSDTNIQDPPSPRESVIGTEDEDEVAEERDLDDKLEEMFAISDLDEILEQHLELKALQKKTIQFAEHIIEPDSDDESDAESGSTDTFRDALDTMSNAGQEQAPGLDQDLEVIRIRDVRGQIYNLPFEKAKVWEVSFSSI